MINSLQFKKLLLTTLQHQYYTTKKNIHSDILILKSALINHLEGNRNKPNHTIRQLHNFHVAIIELLSPLRVINYTVGSTRASH